MTAQSSRIPFTPTKFFTPEEAQRALALIVPIMADAKKELKLYFELSNDLELLEEHLREHPEDAKISLAADEQEEKIEDSLKKLQHFAGEIQEIGCRLTDVEIGLVDFPAQINGRTVFLCWRIDEERVQYWHDVEKGFADRHPLL